VPYSTSKSIAASTLIVNIIFYNIKFLCLCRVAAAPPSLPLKAVMLKATLKQTKRLAYSRLAKILSNKRFGINNFCKTSFEFSMIQEFNSPSAYSSEFLNTVSLIIKEFGLSAKDIVLPPLINSEHDNDLQYSVQGQHYHLLPILINALNCKKVIEIGTFLGASSKSILLNTDAQVLTFDLIPYEKISLKGYLSQEDLNLSRFRQECLDLGEKHNFTTKSSEFNNCDLIFLDGPKDGSFEQKFLNNIIEFCKNRDKSIYLLIDDIRVSSMVSVWNKIPYPKFDLSSIGHWSGSGLVHVNPVYH